MDAMAGEPQTAAVGPEAARLLFERTDNFVCTLDLEGRFTAVNPGGEAVSGYSAGELIGRFASDLIPPAQRDEAVRHFRRRLTGEANGRPVEATLLRRDGTDRKSVV